MLRSQRRYVTVVKLVKEFPNIFQRPQEQHIRVDVQKRFNTSEYLLPPKYPF